MAEYNGTLTIFAPAAHVFDYLAQFTNAAEWDPGTKRASMLSSEPIGVGSRFELIATALGREIPLTYEISRYEPHRRVVFAVHGTHLSGVDDIAVEDTENGTKLTYRAELRFTGWQSIVNPLFGLAFKRVGDRALAGLRRTLVTKLT